MAAFTAFAQSYKLTEMSQETFAAGGGDLWSFQKYQYATGQYTDFAMFGNESTCNYRNTAFSWKSPYAKINTSSVPVYKFVLCQAPAETPTVIEGVDCGNGAKAVSVEYFTVGGQKVKGVAKGLVIRRITHEDGSISCTKMVR